MIIKVDGKEYRVHMHLGVYSQVYVRVERSPGMMRRNVFGIIERRVKYGGKTWNKVVGAHKAAVSKVQ